MSTDSKGWTKELNSISYNEKSAVWDIRKWSPNGKMSRGIILKNEELTALQEALQTLEIKKGETIHGYGN
ncbi:PC4/YdbC family ssDNA-binding protein [Streptococcus respiraculi]|uniref:PC4/YdbC family ssDNA-binding protein n=1 Tax=Streptococcus respiraculi TaxID=2021971 RepID=UPI001F0C4E09|nr:PC4/YdbC family ssDNA-binding protein [Streptococcus respiraculi]